MKAPKDHWIIQIDITNACVHSCSNCSRSCQHQKKPFMMDYETFCKAVDSIIEHPGIIGVMGGEPTLHPDFERFCEYLREKLGADRLPKAGAVAIPTDDYFQLWKAYEYSNLEIHNYEDGPRAIIKGAGLWTSLSKEYISYLETIQDTFRFQCLNDHQGISLHQPVLISRKDMGISDDEWVKLRDKCWINQTWSSSITPKGCFFCEVAAALDYMYDGPGGLPIEKNWWKRDISDFAGQFHWCDLCGIPLKTFARDANECITDVSETNYKLMKEHGLIRLDDDHLNVVKIKDGKVTDDSKASKYVGRLYIDNTERVTQKAPIHASKFYGIVVCNDEISDESIKEIFSRNEDCLESVRIVKESEGFNGLRKALEDIGDNKYVFCFTPDIKLRREGINRLKKCVINPGTLHYIDFSISHLKENDYICNSDTQSSGICLLLNTNAKSLKSDNVNNDNKCSVLEYIRQRWANEKVVELSNRMNGGMYNGKVFTKNKERRIKWKAYLTNSSAGDVAKHFWRRITNRLFIKDKSLWV